MGHVGENDPDYDDEYFLTQARAFLYVNGSDDGDRVTLSFESGGKALADLLHAMFEKGCWFSAP